MFTLASLCATFGVGGGGVNISTVFPKHRKTDTGKLSSMLDCF